MPAFLYGEGDAQVLEYLLKQDNHLEFAYCMREMMEHRRKQVAAGMGVDIEGEVLAQVWDEKVFNTSDNEFEEVLWEGHVKRAVNIAREFGSMRFQKLWYRVQV